MQDGSRDEPRTSLSEPALRDCVRCFQQRRANIRGAAAAYPIAARPDQFLNSICKTRTSSRLGDAAAPEIVPDSVVVGPCTQLRAQLVLRGKPDVFTIEFRPAGFHRLFRMPMEGFADQAFEARSVIGPKLGDLEQKLACASSFGERACAASAFLLECLAERSGGDAVAAVANRFLSEQGALGVGDAAAEAGLSVRQFERRFSEQVGVPPKLYAASSGSTLPLKPRLARRDDYGPTLRTVSAITTRCTWSGISRIYRRESDSLHPAPRRDGGVVGLKSRSLSRARPPIDWQNH